MIRDTSSRLHYVLGCGILVVCGMALSGGDARAAMDTAERARLAELMRTAAGQQDRAAAGRLNEALESPNFTQDDWAGVFREVYSGDRFTRGHYQLWEHLAGQVRGGRTLALSGAAASIALERELRTEMGSGSDPQHALNALAWLQAIANGLDRSQQDAVLSALLEAARGKGPTLIPGPGLASKGSMPAIYVGTQLCLTVAEYASRNQALRPRVATALGLEGAARTFWEQTGAFLLDNGALDGAQVQSLLGLAAAIPIRLHRVVVIAVPQGLRLDPSQGGFATTGQIMTIEPIAMNVATDPNEWQPEIARPMAPLFTIRAAQQYVRAIQQVQFAERPELNVRLNAILHKAGVAHSTYLLRNIPQGRYVQHPDQLLPDTAYLWFLDTENTFRQVIKHWNIRIKSPADQFLLMADLLSGGGSSTFIYHTSTSGQVTVRETAVGRVRLSGGQPPGVAAPIVPPSVTGPLHYVNAVHLPARVVSFQLDSLGYAATIAGP